MAKSCISILSTPLSFEEKLEMRFQNPSVYHSDIPINYPNALAHNNTLCFKKLTLF